MTTSDKNPVDTLVELEQAYAQLQGPYSKLIWVTSLLRALVSQNLLFSAKTIAHNLAGGHEHIR